MRKLKIKILVCKICCLTLLCFLSFRVVFSYAQEDSKEEEALFVARRAFEDGFYEVSQGLLERFLNTYPNSVKLQEAELLIGQCYFHQEKYIQALNKFNEILGNPKSRDLIDAVYYWIAEIHFKGNNFDKAKQFYQRVVQEKPESSYAAVAYYSLGWCSFQQQNFNQAIEYFEIVEKKFPQEPQAKDSSFKIIESLYNLKQYTSLKEKARDYLKTYCQDKDTSFLYFYMAEADYYLDKLQESIGNYSKTIDSSRDTKIIALSKLGMGWAQLKLKEYTSSEEIFEDINIDNLDKRGKDILLLGRAILMTETNRINEAKKIYGQLLDSASEFLVLMQAYLGKADSLYNLAEYKEAIQVYREALVKADAQRIPQDMIDKLHYNLAWTYLKEGQFKEAIKEFQKIIKETDDKIIKISALCQIGDAYQDSGDYKRAKDSYDAILKDYPDSFYSDYVQYQLGLTLLKVSNYDGAIMSFLTLKKNFPESKLLDDATYALGLAYFQRQDYNLSKDIFEKFKKEFKDSSLSPQSLYLLGTSLFNLTKYTEAIEAFKDIIRMYGNDREMVQKAEYEIADCLYQMGNEKEAMARFEKLRSKYPDSSLSDEIMWWLGEYYYRHNNLVLAQRYFSSLIKDFPKSNLVADAYYAQGVIFQEQSKHQQAIENFNRVIKMHRADLSGQAAIAVADIYLRQQREDLALNAYQEAAKEYPNLTHIIYPKIADHFYNTKDYDKALEFYRRSLDAVPVRVMADIQFKIAEVLELQAKLEQAIEEYLKVTYLYSENNNLAVRALLRVAKIYEDRENFKEALNIYKKITSMEIGEAKYAQERIDWITRSLKQGRF